MGIENARKLAGMLTPNTAGITLTDGVAGAEVNIVDMAVPTGEVWEFKGSDWVHATLVDLAAASMAASGTMRVKKTDSTREQAVTLLEGLPGDFAGAVTDVQMHMFFGASTVIEAGERFIISHEEPVGGSGCDISASTFRVPFSRFVRRV